MLAHRQTPASGCDSAGGPASAAVTDCPVAALDPHLANEREQRRRNMPAPGPRSATGIATAGRLRRDQPVYGVRLGQARAVSPLARDCAAGADRLYLSPCLHARFS